MARLRANIYLLFSVFSFTKYCSTLWHLYSYTELEQLKTTHPVRVRSYNWCFSIPPRCSNYRTEQREVTKLQVSVCGQCAVHHKTWKMFVSEVSESLTAFFFFSKFQKNIVFLIFNTSLLSSKFEFHVSILQKQIYVANKSVNPNTRVLLKGNLFKFNFVYTVSVCNYWITDICYICTLCQPN